MSLKCKGDWDSWVGVSYPPTVPRNDGKLVIGAGKSFKGKHKKTRQYDLKGSCKESPHHIDFKTDEGYRYYGDIVEINGELWVTNGTRTTAKVKATEKMDDDEWVAVKTT
jgi:hypothetical protein